MNKTVNVNLGGIFFHIDEDAYQKLSRYFDAIKRSLTNSSGQDEIIKDIEMRVSELLSEKQKSEKHVVAMKDVDEVILVMGQPEDYRIDEDNEPQKATNFSSTFTNTRTKKLYRDTENGMIGGVLSGLGHYFGFDKVWLRMAMLVLIFAFGTGFLAYIILWIAMPEAKTTADKLEMTGEPVNISSIEKKVREEFENVSEKFKNADFDKYGNQVKSGAEKIGSSLGDIIIGIVKAFSKFIGVIFVITGMFVLVALLIGIFTLGSTTTFIDLPWSTFVETGNFTDYPTWVFGLIMFFAVGIPFFFLMLLGFKLVSPKSNSIGSIAKYTLLAIWLIAVALAASIGIRTAKSYSNEGRDIQKEVLNINPKDTLLIKFIHNDYFAKNIDDNDNFKITQDSIGNKVIYSNNIVFKIVETDGNLPSILIEKESKGKTLSEAKQRAEQIKYNYKLVGNQLILDNYLLTDLKNKFRDQEVEIKLFLPKGTLFKADESVQNYDESDDDYFNLHYSSDDYVYKVNTNKIKCITCPEYENEDIDNEDDNTSVNIDEDGITIKNDTLIKSKKKFSELKINEDGIIIKTK